MNINIISIFPEIFQGFLEHSMIKRALENKILNINVINPRDFAENKHKQVDDTPYGGGSGMLMMAPPIFRAVESLPIKEETRRRIIFMGPAGKKFDQAKAKELAEFDELVIICGHYEGVDYRVEEHLVDETISIGDYVLTGGELPSMVVIDAVARMLPGVLGTMASAIGDSFYTPLLECPHYTKPRIFREFEVPEVLLSGHHKNIEDWRFFKSVERTKKLRPDLLNRELSAREIKILREIEDGNEC